MLKAFAGNEKLMKMSKDVLAHVQEKLGSY